MITKPEVDYFSSSLWTNCNQNSVCLKETKQYLCLALQLKTAIRSFFFYPLKRLIACCAGNNSRKKINLLKCLISRWGLSVQACVFRCLQMHRRAEDDADFVQITSTAKDINIRRPEHDWPTAPELRVWQPVSWADPSSLLRLREHPGLWMPVPTNTQFPFRQQGHDKCTTVGYIKSSGRQKKSQSSFLGPSSLCTLRSAAWRAEQRVDSSTPPSTQFKVTSPPPHS